MKRRICSSFVAAAVCLTFGLLTSCSNSRPKPASISATSGTPQSTAVNTAFAAPLVATVLDSNSRPVSGATVTFAAPTSGASCVLSSATMTTDANGKASVTCTANATLGAYNVTATVTGVMTAASFSLTNSAGPPATITATSGSGQSTIVKTAFANPLVATVKDSGGNLVSGATVTFTAPGSGASGTFANGTATDTETTISGVATSTTFTANATTGTYNVSASVSGVATPATFSLTNKPVPGTNYVFYLSGLEAPNANNGSVLNYYALAGVVTINANGVVVTGEEDYNDGNGITQTGVSITGGTLTVNATTGQGTLQLITNSSFVGVSGTETLGVQFANTNHALIIQFDGSATSSGSMDTQTATSIAAGSFAFTLAGVDTNNTPVGYGGIFSVSGADAITGTADVNDAGAVTTDSAFSGSMGAADSFGRGQMDAVSINGTALTLIYYTVGSEVIRIIDVDVITGNTGSGGAAIGSALGQGASAGSFSATLTTPFVFGVEQVDSFGGYLYAAAGMFSPTSGTTNITGVGDLDEEGTLLTASPITGSYTLGNTGYGSLAVASGLSGIATLGMYLTDPALNLLDPNNTTGGGGALLLDLDTSLYAGGAGVMIPQTDTAAAKFKGAYVFGGQVYNDVSTVPTTGPGNEFDFVGEGMVSSLALTAGGLVNDPFGFFATTGEKYSAVPLSGTAVADANESTTGRYTMASLAVNPTGTAKNFTVAIYQANGGQLFWLNNDDTTTYSLFLGTLQQQGSLAGIPAARIFVPKTEVNGSP